MELGGGGGGEGGVGGGGGGGGGAGGGGRGPHCCPLSPQAKGFFFGFED